VFKSLSATVVLLYRKERVTERGRLHSDRRGGWAAVSGHTEARLGGLWTARSFEVVEKLFNHANRKLASSVE
jgi:hypothetical protein